MLFMKRKKMTSMFMSRASFVFFLTEKKTLQFPCSTSAQTPGFLSVSVHLLINLMVITESAVPSAQLLGLGLIESVLWDPNNPQHMLIKDLTPFMQGLSQVCQKQASERKALLAPGVVNVTITHLKGFT